MIKTLYTAALLLLIVLNAGCSYSSVDAGEEATLTYQPWIFGHGGVDPTPVSTGAIWTAWSTRVDRFPIVPIKFTEKFVDLTASDNVAIDFDTYLTLKIQKGKTPVLRELSGMNWYSNKVKDQYRMLVRNEARARTSIELRTNQESILAAQDRLKGQITEYIASIKLPVEVVKVVISKVVPPDEVLAESAQTAAQKQRKQTQDQRKLAEDARRAAEEASAIADKAYTQQFHMTTDQFLENKRLEIMSRAVDKGTVSLIMNASDAQPIFNTNTQPATPTKEN